MGTSNKDQQSTTLAEHSPGRESDKLIRDASRHLRAGRFHDAQTSLHHACKLQPNRAEIHNQLGKVYIALDRMPDAAQSISRSLEIEPDSHEAHNILGIVYNRLGRTEDAILSFECALKNLPSNTSTRMNLAMTLKEAGRLEGAVEQFQQVLAARPGISQAHFHLAHMRNHESSSDEINAMISLYELPETRADEKMYLAFGLGSALEKNGRYDEAFNYFKAGHQIRRQSLPFDLARRVVYFGAIMDAFNKDYFSRNQASGPVENMPIFIFGMPRSGTTLAEQILASHPRVQGAGELGYMEDVVQQVVKMTGKPFLIAWNSMSGQEKYKFGADYIDKLKTHSDGAAYVIDTTPMNFRYVGLIATILPGARFVHCVRDPMDTCLSIYQQPLSDTHAYANDLEDLGGFYQLYRKLMAHWHEVLPGRIFDLCYEELVADSECEIRKLLDYCGLEFHKDCLSFHKTERSIRTPSDSQVRQPIYTASVNRWKRYETQLAPLKAILG